MQLEELRAEIQQHNTDHPDLPACIIPNCPNKVKPAWDNKVLCYEHKLVVDHWVVEKSGFQFDPEVRDFDTGKKLPRPAGSDENKATYRKRYCDWVTGLSPEIYLDILKYQIGDEREVVP
jgi:hypothetical protein